MRLVEPPLTLFTTGASLMHRVALNNSQEELVIRDNLASSCIFLNANCNFGRPCGAHFQRVALIENVQGDNYRELGRGEKRRLRERNGRDFFCSTPTCYETRYRYAKTIASITKNVQLSDTNNCALVPARASTQASSFAYEFNFLRLGTTIS